jgi:hypothetical protein
MEEFDEIPEAVIVRPTPQEVAEGVARLELDIQHWRENPALLIVKPELALIVSVIDHETDDNGFRLRLAIMERLLAPPEFNIPSMDVECGWNQPYMSFNRDGIHAPYSFSLYFGKQGVDRAREAFHLKMARVTRETPFDFALLRWCFSEDGEEYLAMWKKSLPG